MQSTRMWVQVVYLGGDPSKQERGSRENEMRKGKKGNMNALILGSMK